jgi:hypothetical protein
MGRRGMHREFCGKTGSKETLGIPNSGWEDSIKMAVR